MTVKIGTSTIPAQTELFVDEYRFLAKLHTHEQRIELNAAHAAGQTLDNAHSRSKDLSLRDENNYPVWALQIIVLAYRDMRALGGRVDLLTPGMIVFFQAAKACGVYGLDEAVADAEIARIMRNETPST